MADRNLRFLGLLKEARAFALVHQGLLAGPDGAPIPVAIKQVLLKTGLHFARQEGVHKIGARVVDEAAALLAFSGVRFGDMLFKRRAVPPHNITDEVKHMSELHAQGLAPKVYSAWIDKDTEVHVGYIVMARCDGTVKDVLLRRKLTPEEDALVQDLFHALHERLQCTHGDLKPSNVGVVLDERGHIASCLFLDCAGIRPRSPKRSVGADLAKYQRTKARLEKKQAQ